MSAVHAFSPQTFVCKSKRFIHRDRRWQEQIANLQRAKSAQSELYDLKRVLESRKSENTRFHIYFSTIDRLDKIHAGRMKAVPNVFLHPYNDGGHGLVKHLRDSGLLKNILLEALNGG